MQKIEDLVYFRKLFIISLAYRLHIKSIFKVEI